MRLKYAKLYHIKTCIPEQHKEILYKSPSFSNNTVWFPQTDLIWKEEMITRTFLHSLRQEVWTIRLQAVGNVPFMVSLGHRKIQGQKLIGVEYPVFRIYRPWYLNGSLQRTSGLSCRWHAIHWFWGVMSSEIRFFCYQLNFGTNEKRSQNIFH